MVLLLPRTLADQVGSAELKGFARRAGRFVGADPVSGFAAPGHEPRSGLDLADPVLFEQTLRGEQTWVASEHLCYVDGQLAVKPGACGEVITETAGRGEPRESSGDLRCAQSAGVS